LFLFLPCSDPVAISQLWWCVVLDGIDMMSKRWVRAVFHKNRAQLFCCLCSLR
jgi:hypothetical protein